MTTWSDYPCSRRPGPDRDQDSLEPGAGEHQPREYVTEISVPDFGDDGRQALYAPGLAEPEPGARPGGPVVPRSGSGSRSGWASSAPWLWIVLPWPGPHASEITDEPCLPAADSEAADLRTTRRTSS